MIKKILKFIMAALIGGIIGLAGAAVVLVVVKDDITFSGVIDKLASAQWTDAAVGGLIAVGALIVSVPVHTLLHEAGHLVCGLATGYEFVSFRIFSFTFIRLDGKLRLRRYAIAGTGGQCLLTPGADVTPERMPVMWYNAGGVLANAVTLAAVAPLLLCELPAAAMVALMVFELIGLMILLTNAIPINAGGIRNDASNMLLMCRDGLSRRALYVQLRANALMQQGVRPKDMPAEWTQISPDFDYRNSLVLAQYMLHIAVLMDNGDNEAALTALERLHARRKETVGLLVKEIECEIVYTALATGRHERAAELLTPALLQYIKTYSKVSSAKSRCLYAIALYRDHDGDAAQRIYDGVAARRDKYLMQGEVASDLELMARLPR